MKLLVVFPAFIAFGAGSAIPTIPGDNSHYVEGESRYIWMPDGEGTPHLVDLEQPVDEAVLRSRNGANNQYRLFTRSNPNNAQIIVNGDANTIWSSNYNGSNGMRVIVHGWLGNGNSEENTFITPAFLAVQDVNVIVVDWSSLAISDYVTAANGVPGVGQYLGNFLVWLINTAGGDWNNVHLIGFSLGAHVVGNTGREVRNQVARVTGLDPAGPLWDQNPNALRNSDGQYVEGIHTDSGILGTSQLIGNTDFFPNGGNNLQPGCLTSICSHSRSYKLFASSVRTDHFVGRLCSNTQQATRNQCTGDTLNMGNGNISKQGSGIYGLRTGYSWPY